MIGCKYVVKVREEIRSLMYNVTCNASNTRNASVLLAKKSILKPHDNNTRNEPEVLRCV